MLFSDRKIRDYLDRPADSGMVPDLEKEGILPFGYRFRAVSLCRDDLCWAKRLRKTVRLLAAVFLVSGLVLMPASGYHVLFSAEGFYVLCALFFFFGVFSRFPSIWSAVAEYMCVFLSGILFFLPDPDFNNVSGIWRPFGLWTLFLFLWAMLSRRIGIKAVFLVCAAFFLFLYAFQVALPTGTVGWEEFVYCFSALSGAAVFGLEFLNKRFPEYFSSVFSLRFVFEVFFMLSALILPVQTCLGIYNAPAGFLWALVCSVASAVFGVFYCPRAAFHKVNAFFFLSWSSLGVFSLLQAFFEKQTVWGVFSVLFFALVLATGGVERFLVETSRKRGLK